tara:strand:- start:1591 stop:2559 length:969 start_codon:yes stop_codon:yes gene_type:complete
LFQDGSQKGEIVAQVWLPSELQSYAGGQQIVEIEGSSVRQIVNNLDMAFPGLKECLYDPDMDQIVGSMAVIIDGETSQLGLLDKVDPASEVHFLPAIGGGASSKVIVIGIGPGDPDFITLKAKNILKNSDSVAGFTTVLSVVESFIPHENLIKLTYRNQEELLMQLAEDAKEGKRCVLCAWGDINFSASELIERIRNKVEEIELIPCVSSVQIAASRSGLKMEESIFITLHKRSEDDDLKELNHYLNEGNRNIILIPRPFDLMPQAIAKGLIANGQNSSKIVTVYQKLSMSDEVEWHGSLEELCNYDSEFSDLSIIVIEKAL